MSDYIEELNTRFRKTILEGRGASGASEPMGELELAMEVTRRVDAHLDFMQKQFWERQWDELEREDSAAGQEEQLDEPDSSDSQCPPTYHALPRSVEEVRRDLQDQRSILAQHLKGVGVACVFARYEGSSDVGMLDSMFQDANGQLMMTVPQEIEDLRGALTELFCELLEERHRGWQVDAGAYGTFVWDLTTLKLHHWHHARRIEESVSEKEGL